MASEEESAPRDPGPWSWWVTAWAAQGGLIFVLDWGLAGWPPLTAHAVLRIHLIGALAALPMIALYWRLARRDG